MEIAKVEDDSEGAAWVKLESGNCEGGIQDISISPKRGKKMGDSLTSEEISL